LVVYTNWIGWFFLANWIGFKLAYICNFYFECKYNFSPRITNWEQLGIILRLEVFFAFGEILRIILAQVRICRINEFFCLGYIALRKFFALRRILSRQRNWPVADKIHLWRLILFTHSKCSEKQIFPAYGMNFSALLVFILLI
jgi:hypothetical protein